MFTHDRAVAKKNKLGYFLVVVQLIHKADVCKNRAAQQPEIANGTSHGWQWAMAYLEPAHRDSPGWSPPRPLHIPRHVQGRQGVFS